MKKALSILILCAIILSMICGCADTSYIMTNNGDKYAAGPFAFYAQYLHDYYDQMLTYYYQQNLTDILNKEVDENGTKLYENINKEIKQQYIRYIVLDKKFAELGLSMTEEETKEINDAFEYYKSNYKTLDFTAIRQKLGLSEDEFKNLLVGINYKEQKLMNYYFGAGGENEISDTEMRKYFTENYRRFKYLVFYKTNSDGTTLGTEDLLKKYEKVKEAKALLDEGQSFERLIPIYSEDYYKRENYPDATDETWENYEAQNTENTENGLITNKNGIFDETVYNYYGYSLDTKVADAVFTLEIGEYTLIELDKEYWIIKRYDASESNDYFKSKETTIYNTLASPQFETLCTTWDLAFAGADLEYCKFNETVVNMYDVRGLETVFKQESAEQ